MFKMLRKKDGQAMTEYVIIICIVAIAVLLVVGVFGTNIRNLFSSANSSLVAGQAQAQTMQAQGGGQVRINDVNDKK
jgi:pilus assembly protein Flp/PilA